MEDYRVGLMVRGVRLKRGLRQVDVANRAALSQQTISRIEAGELDNLTLGVLRAVSRALRMPPIVTLGWRGADVARLLDEAHASAVDQVVSCLRQLGWKTAVEYSFNEWGERGSVDVVGWREDIRALLIVEVKTRIVDLQDLHSAVDRKLRIVPALLARERGWRADHVGLVLAVIDTSTNRRALRLHSATFGVAFPARTVEVRRWLSKPLGQLRGIWILSSTHAMGASAGTRRVRRRVPARRADPHARPSVGKTE